jgi:hypothetical protein
MGQCLNRRIDNMDFMRAETEAWQNDRNNKNATIDWQFKSEEARIKLKKLYPSINV